MSANAKLNALLKDRPRAVRNLLFGAAVQAKVPMFAVVTAALGRIASPAAQAAAKKLPPGLCKGLESLPFHCPHCQALGDSERVCTYCKAAHGCSLCVTNNGGCPACREERARRVTQEARDAAALAAKAGL